MSLTDIPGNIVCAMIRCIRGSVGEQIATVYAFCQNERFPVSYEELARAFLLSKQRIGQIMLKWKLYGVESGPSGRPRLLTQEEVDQVITFINERYLNQRPATLSSIGQYIRDEFDRSLGTEQIRSILKYNSRVRFVEGVRMETGRVDCPSTSIDSWFSSMTDVCANNIPAAFVLNVDEVGTGGPELDRDVRCIVPSTHIGPTVPIPNELRVDHSTMIAAIAASGQALKPLIVLQRKTVDAELRAVGYSNDKILYAHSPTGYINSNIFLRWVSEICVPYLREQRKRTGYLGEAALLLDGCSCHDPERITALLAPENAKAHFLPAHSSDQIQPLDLGIFGVMKARMAGMQTDASFGPVSRQIMRMFDAWQMTTTPSNVVMAFRRAGLKVTWKQTEHDTYVSVDTRYATKVRHLQQQDGFLIERDRRRTTL